ncbi:hypothetical protein CE91St41_16770 [Oscillospiraceae bacterium]|nr:hypothetical protein CE91St40_20770 [Oscillospiraceae bacterium]BDF74788.1 hypothetical protein CE91St41_16770 [Oscillospiraceae bacterium]
MSYRVASHATIFFANELIMIDISPSFGSVTLYEVPVSVETQPSGTVILILPLLVTQY